jgi:hypothetical protein
VGSEKVNQIVIAVTGAVVAAIVVDQLKKRGVIS